MFGYILICIISTLLRAPCQSHPFVLRTKLASEDQIPISHKEKNWSQKLKGAPCFPVHMFFAIKKLFKY